MQRQSPGEVVAPERATPPYHVSYLTLTLYDLFTLRATEKPDIPFGSLRSPASRAPMAFVSLGVIFVTATLLGFASSSPGGLDVFDATMLAGPWQFDKETLIAGLLLFRLLYFIVPFIAALAILAIPELCLDISGPGVAREPAIPASDENERETPKDKDPAARAAKALPSVRQRFARQRRKENQRAAPSGLDRLSWSSITRSGRRKCALTRTKSYERSKTTPGMLSIPNAMPLRCLRRCRPRLQSDVSHCPGPASTL